jgi:hypothetical protein
MYSEVVGASSFAMHSQYGIKLVMRLSDLAYFWPKSVILGDHFALKKFFKRLYGISGGRIF